MKINNDEWSVLKMENTLHVFTPTQPRSPASGAPIMLQAPAGHPPDVSAQLLRMCGVACRDFDDMAYYDELS